MLKMYIDEIPVGTNIFDGKKVYVYGRPYIYFEEPEELKNVLRKYGATIHKQVDGDTDIIIYSYWAEQRSWEPFPKNLDDKIHSLFEDDLYTILYGLGERRSKYRKFLKEKPDTYYTWHFTKIYEFKQLAKENWYAYPSFEDKNVFIHGRIEKYKKTVIRLLEKHGGFLVDQFDDDTDIVVIGSKFSLEFIARMEEIRKHRRLIIVDEETFFCQFEILSEFESGSIIGTRVSEDLDWKLLIRNEEYYAEKLLSKGQANKAIEIYQKLLSIDDNKYSYYWAFIADVYKTIGEFEKAINALNRHLAAYLLKYPPQIGVADEYLAYTYSEIARLQAKIEKSKQGPIVKKSKPKKKTKVADKKRNNSTLKGKDH